MAVQMGILPLAGSIGNISFYKLGDKWVARTKGGASAEKVATDPNMQRTRENASEFGTAAKAGKLMRTALQALANPVADNRMVRRLTSRMLLVLQAGTIGFRGLRKVVDGKMDLLQGFEFNGLCNLHNSFFASYDSEINREMGELKISIPPFIPSKFIAPPVSATHFKLNVAGAALDFESDEFSVELDESPLLALDSGQTDEMVLKARVPANTSVPLFLVLGIEFHQEMNGMMYPLRDAAFNALAIVKVAVR